jgi:hypothetical protein
VPEDVEGPPALVPSFFATTRPCTKSEGVLRPSFGTSCPSAAQDDRSVARAIRLPDGVIRGSLCCHPETAAGHEVPEDVEGPPALVPGFSPPPDPAQNQGVLRPSFGTSCPSAAQDDSSVARAIRLPDGVIRDSVCCHPETAAGHEVPEDVEGPPALVPSFLPTTPPCTRPGGPSPVLRHFVSFGGSG